MTSPDQSWLPRAPDAGAECLLFCFPYAGAGASIYRTWQACFPRALGVVPLQPPGRESRIREASFDDLDRMVEAVVDVLRPHLDRPFAFFGHSFGALVAFEVARALRQAGARPPSRIFASARPAPDAPVARCASSLPDDEIIAELGRDDGTPPSVLGDRELMQALLPAIRSDLALNESYAFRPEVPLDVAFTVFGGTHDTIVQPETLCGWAGHSSRSCALQMFEGGHFFLREHERRLAERITRDLSLGPFAIADRSPGWS
jgi:medium-chain acyl-[acyl-carrier-protein] hydrolase